jgi:hypothetical protein
MKTIVVIVTSIGSTILATLILLGVWKYCLRDQEPKDDYEEEEEELVDEEVAALNQLFDIAEETEEETKLGDNSLIDKINNS